MIIWQTIQHSLTITTFVAMMMVILEYINVLSSGLWMEKLSSKKLNQYFICALLGIIPGCLGAFAVVGLFMHKRVTIGALVAAMIATSGDEAFVMFSLFPKTALLVTGGLFITGILIGFLVDFVVNRSKHQERLNKQTHCDFHTHAQKYNTIGNFSINSFLGQWRHPSPIRGILTASIGIFLFLMFANQFGSFHRSHSYPPPKQTEQRDGRVGHDGHVDHDEHVDHDGHAEHDGHTEHDKHTEHDGHAGHNERTVHTSHNALTEQNADTTPLKAKLNLPKTGGHHHEESQWERWTLIILCFLGLFVITTVSDHFLEDHLWKHVLRTHVPRIFLWTLGALAAIALLNHFVDVDSLVKTNIWLVLLAAIAIGLIPESGPHLVFVTLFFSGTIPFSILFASCIVQDGHGMVPLLAHSRRNFLFVKGINGLIGLAIGASMLALGF